MTGADEACQLGGRELQVIVILNRVIVNTIIIIIIIIIITF